MIDASPDGKLVSLLVLGLAAIGGWTAMVRPQLVLVFVISYAPFSRAYPYPLLGLPGLNGANLALGMGILAWVVSGIRRERRSLIGFECVLLAYLALGALGAVRGQLASGGIELVDLAIDYRGWAAPALLFFIARGTVEEGADADAVLTVLALTAFLAGVLTWHEGLELQGGRGIEEQRAIGILGQANSMGAFLAYYGIPLLALALSRGRFACRGLSLCAFLVVARAVIFTYSRGAVLALGVGSAAVVGLSSFLGIAIVSAGALTVGSFPELLPGSVRARFAHTTHGDTEILDESLEAQLDSSSAKRLNLWRGGLEMMRQHPVAGTGLYRFSATVPHYAPEEIAAGDPTDAHNAFVLVGAELGLPALALLLLLFAWMGIAGLAGWWWGRDPPERRLALACVGSLAAVLVGCMFGSRLSDDALIGIFWCLMGTLFAMRTRPAENPEWADR